MERMEMQPVEAVRRADRANQEEPLFLAGELVGPGLYREVASRREVQLEREDRLPATCDGKVACYLRIVAFPHEAVVRSRIAEPSSTLPRLRCERLFA